MAQDKRKSPRSASIIMDWVHIVIGLLIVILGVITFLNPEGHRFLFPVIFLLAALLNLFNGIHKYRQSGRDKKKKAAAFVQYGISVLLLAVTVASAISIWR